MQDIQQVTLGQQFGHNRAEYTAGKTAFIQRITSAV